MPSTTHQPEPLQQQQSLSTAATMTECYDGAGSICQKRLCVIVCTQNGKVEQEKSNNPQMTNDIDNNHNINNNKTTVLILGGYGNTGRVLTRLLVQIGQSPSTKIHHLIVAGRHLDRAQDFIHEFYSEYGSSHYHGKFEITALVMDAADSPESLAAVLRQHQVTLLIVASSSTKYMEHLALAALEARVDLVDVQYSTSKTECFQRLKPAIEQAGCCFITDCGFHPGLPAALIRYMHATYDQTSPDSRGLVSAVVSSVIRIDWSHLETELSVETMMDFAGEFVDFSTRVYQNGKWKEAGFWCPTTIHFSEPFGKQPCVPMYLEELKDLPEMYPALQETGFYVGSLNWVVDWFLSPIVMVAMKLWSRSLRVQRTMGRLLLWGLKRFSKPPYGTLLRVEVKDEAGHQNVMTISHKDGYALTAIAVAATIMQYLDRNAAKSLRKPGLWLQGTAVEPVRLVHDMEDMLCGPTEAAKITGHTRRRRSGVLS